MVATSVGITAQVLAAKGVLNERASQLILAAAVIDDVLGLLVLAVVSSVARGRVDVRSILATTLIAAVFTLAGSLISFGSPVPTPRRWQIASGSRSKIAFGS